MSEETPIEVLEDKYLWTDSAWLDTLVVVGLTCFILCLMNLSKVSSNYDNAAAKQHSTIFY